MSGFEGGWYKRYPKKFIRGVRGLGPDAIGAYAVILDLIYEDEDSCPNDPKWLGGILGCPGQKAAALVRKLVEAGKLHLGEDGRLRNERASEALGTTLLSNISPKKRGDVVQKTPRRPPEDRTTFNGNNELAPIDKIRQDKKRKEEDISLELPLAEASNFDAWYTTYPRRVGRGQAEKAYRRALSKTTAANLLAGAQRYATERNGQDPAYTKHPATWLNGECWKDEPPETVESAQEKIARRAREVFREPKRAIANLSLTFPDEPYRALEKIEDAAGQKNPDGALNEWLWKHGPPGVDVGAMD